MNDFVDRYNELHLFRQKYQKINQNGELVVLYGRRRLGKTTLIKKFIERIGCKSIYFFVSLSSEKDLMKQFSKTIQNQTKKEVKIKEWESFFKFLSVESKNRPLIIAIDEFQRIDEVSRGFVSLFQHYWDSELKQRKIMIILSGSSIGLMKKLALGPNAPLFGRVTTKKRLKPFRYIDFRTMFTELGEEDRMKLYTVFGGTPHYLELVKKEDEKNIYKKIHNLILKEGAPLKDEPETLLSTELDSYARYNGILHALSKGKIELNEIQNFLGMNRGGKITPYLKTLETLLDLIEKKNPLLGRKRQARYTISDNFFRFWYKFIFSNRSLLELKNYDVIINKVKTRLEKQIGFIFEDVVKELLKLYNGKKIKGININFEDIGSWWYKDQEIDLVMPGHKNLMLGEVKWSKHPMNMDILEQLKDKSKEIDFKGIIRYILVSKSGFEADLKRRMDREKILYLDLKNISELFDQKTKEEKTRQTSLSNFFGI